MFEWAENNSFKKPYSTKDAPSLLVDRSPQHSIITNRQNQRRDARVKAGNEKWSSTAKEEMNNSASDLRAAGIPEPCRRKALKKSYKYLDSIGAFDK